MISPITFGEPMQEPRCGDCSEFAEGWFCTMNCGPIPRKEPESMAEQSKPRVSVQAGRQGGPKQAAAVASLPAERPRANLPGPPEPTSLYGALLQAARDREVDPERLKIIYSLLVDVEEREGKKAFTRAFNALQFELPAIDKDGYIDHGEGKTARGHDKLKTRYSTYPNLMRVCRPLLKKHGFTFNNVIEPSEDGSRILVVGYLTHVDGHGMISRFPMSIDSGPGRSNAQGWGSSSSYGKRYNLILMLDIVSEDPRDQDDDARRPPQEDRSLISADQATQLRKAIDECGVGADRFCEKFEIDALPKLPASEFKRGMEACKLYGEEIKRRRAAGGQDDNTFPGDR